MIRLVARRSRRGPGTDVADTLPARFYQADAAVDGGVMVGLASYMSDLADYLHRQFGEQALNAVDVMTALGIPPSEWYRAMLGVPPSEWYRGHASW